MKHRSLIIAALVLAGSAVALPQEKKMEMPKPGPEVKRLGYFVGAWKSEGEIKENPMMPAGKSSETSKCEWFHGGFQVVCHFNGVSPMGRSQGLGILAYKNEDNAYIYYGIDSLGFVEASKGNVEGSKWTYTSDEKMKGKTYHGRYRMNELSPTSYTFTYEMSEDGQTWSTIMEGKSTKAATKSAETKK